MPPKKKNYSNSVSSTGFLLASQSMRRETKNRCRHNCSENGKKAHYLAHFITVKFSGSNLVRHTFFTCHRINININSLSQNAENRLEMDVFGNELQSHRQMATHCFHMHNKYAKIDVGPCAEQNVRTLSA